MMPALDALRGLPSVDELLQAPPLAEAASRLGHQIVLRATRAVLQESRDQLRSASGGPAPTTQELADRAAVSAWATVAPSLKRVVNATGVVVHTNLGRAPLCDSAVEAMVDIARGYSTLEFNLARGSRGERHVHLEGLLRDLLGVEAAMVVNNTASALLLALTCLARGKEVILSRGQAVEIGGSFRIPDIMRRGGAKLVEVGTTNRTYLSDYENAITERTAMLLAVHASNFRVVGFEHTVDLAELSDLGRRRGLPVLHDQGSGCLIDTRRFGLAPEPMVQASVAAGVSLACFSGDKLLGGPQAGIIVGSAELIARLKRDPLARAIRVDKLTLAALHATLVEYLKGTALEAIPVWRMISRDLESIQGAATEWAAALPGTEVVPGFSAIGGGSLPGETLPTALLRLPRRRAAPRVLEALRQQHPPVIARIMDDAVVLDPRTVQEGEEPAVLQAVRAVLA